MKAEAVWLEGYKFLLSNDRGHKVTVDLRREKGGEDVGPTPLELAVMSLAGCLGVIFKVVAEKRRFRFDGLRVTLEAEKPKGASTITRVRGQVRVNADNEEEAERVLRITLRNCPVEVLFRRSGVDLEWDLIVDKPKT